MSKLKNNTSDKYKILFEKTADAILIIEGDRFIDCNNATVKMLRYKNKQDLLNTHPSKLSPEYQQDGRLSYEKANEMIELAFKNGNHRFEWEHVRADGEIFPVEVLLTAIPDEEKDILYVVWRDITNRKEAEKKVDEHRLQLEEMNKNLKRLDKLKDEFLANTSHELRTPLNGIIGLAESLINNATGPLRKDTQDNLAMIIASGKRLSNLINDILDFSKLRYKELKLQPRAVDIKIVTDIILALSAPLAQGKQLKLVNAISASIESIIADEDRLQQILYNLIGNSLKFTEKGEIKVEAIKKDDFIEVSVIDTGIGLAKDKQDCIFESFEQADGSISRKYGGTGLGLAVTKQLVELHGGTIGVESTLGKGARFYFTMPVSPEKATSQPLVKETNLEHIAEAMADDRLEVDSDLISKQSNWNSIRISGKVLVIDDEPINLQVLSNQLSLWGVSCEKATNGHQGIKMINDAFNKGVPFDCILLDVMMPGMSGYDVCQQLRQTYKEDSLPIIMVTAKNLVENLRAGFRAGANDYISKPFSGLELAARIETQIKIKLLGDISRKLQADLETHKANLEVEVEQRTRELGETHAMLMESARLAGKTEIVSNILHNVGNILNSLGIDADVLRDSVEGMKFDNMKRLCSLLDSNKERISNFLSSEKGKAVPEYLNKLSTLYSDKKLELLNLAENINHHISHISDIISIHQDFNLKHQLKESVDTEQIIHNIWLLFRHRIEQQKIEFITNSSIHKAVYLDKNRLVQILSNLISNSLDAIAEKHTDTGKITLTTSCKDNSIFFYVEDDGIGFEKSSEVQLFSQGYTTKKGKFGLGLHNSANTASEMGGHLSGTSKGKMKGATFTLELPAICSKPEAS